MDIKKLILLFISINLIIFLAGCTTTTASTAEKNDAKAVTATGQGEATQAAEVKKNLIPVLVSETKFQKTGAVDTKTVNTYKDNTDKLISSIVYDSSSEIFEKTTVEYKGNETIYSYFDKDGNLLRTKKTVSNENGAILETTLYDIKGKQVSKSVFKYNSDFSEKTKWEIYNSKNELLGYSAYIYENGKNTKTENFSPQGDMEEYFVYSYDKNRNMTESSRFNKSGKKVSGIIFEYKNNLPASEKIYRGERTLLNEITYDYSEKGGKKIERQTIKAPDSSIIEIIEKEFSFIEK